MKRRPERALNIADILNNGKENAIPSKELCQITGLQPAALKERIRKERIDNGSLICSDENGYYLAADREEIEAFIKLMERHSFSRLKTLKIFINALKTLDGQQTFDDLEGLNYGSQGDLLGGDYGTTKDVLKDNH